MTDLTKAMKDPGKYFDSPAAVLRETAWTAEQKYQVLRQWKYDIGQLQVATEENMPPPASGPLMARPNATTIADIHKAMEDLGFTPEDDSTPTKGA